MTGKLGRAWVGAWCMEYCVILLGLGGGGLVMVGPDPWRSTSLVLVMSL